MPTFRLPLIALMLSLSAPAMAQSAQDFSLPPGPTPTANPRAQGPVDEEGSVVPVAPRVINTARPTPTATATPTPTPTPTPSATVTSPRSVASPRPTPLPRSVETVPVSPRIPAPQEPVQDIPPVQPTDGTPPIPAPPAAPDVQQPLDEAEIAGPAESAAEDTDWTWLAILVAALAAIGAGLFFWKRRRTSAPAPQIERPVVASVPKANAATAADALTVRLTAEKLTRSAMFATLKYRLTLVNRTDAALSNVTVGVDLVSASAASPMEQQVATTETSLEPKHTLARIAPRQNVAVEGQVQLPLSTAQVIMQGRHPLLVPLMRVRVDGAGDGALVKTFVVGQGQPDGGRVQPFRLDEPPRSYAPIAQRELA
ncbi:LPXTG cell wall anchor domain-containing protein [Qipengyuania sp. 902]|uniref:LPXTG cell wall anchor domain-containing protein n=1 Tax=Qipengyuania sp. 902 TaxID=3417565 RepID=UPI003EBB13A2